MASHNKTLRPAKFDFINTKGHPFVGVTWHIPGSKGNSYEVDMTSKGFLCTCMGFGFRSKCKHTLEIARKIVPKDVSDL